MKLLFRCGVLGLSTWLLVEGLNRRLPHGGEWDGAYFLAVGLGGLALFCGLVVAERYCAYMLRRMARESWRRNAPRVLGQDAGADIIRKISQPIGGTRVGTKH